MQTVLEVIGWVGSALIVLSVMQARVLRFRWMNLAGSIIATAYNAVLGVWPFVAMNAAIAAISAYWLVRLYRESRDPAVYRVMEVGARDAYLQHLLSVHKDDIAHYAPDFSVGDAGHEERRSFLVVRGDEAVGVVIVTMTGGATAQIELDWVKPRFRDFTPGRFVYRESGALPHAGINTVWLAPHDTTDIEYLTRAGFHLEDGKWTLHLEVHA